MRERQAPKGGAEARGLLEARQVCALVLSALALISLAPSTGLTEQKSLPALIQSAGKAVVRIVSIDAQGNEIMQGSGFIMSDGRIATNAHVIKGAAEARVYDHEGYTLASFSYLECLSSALDLAVFPKLADPPGSLSLAISDPPVGEAIITLGSPLNLSNTVSEGIVSAHRTDGAQNLLQITAPISPGSSGGPVLNLTGRVVGMVVSQVEGGQNLNFAIPASAIRVVASAAAERILLKQNQAPSTPTSIPTIEVGAQVTGEFSSSDSKWGTTPGLLSDGYLFKATVGEPLMLAVAATIPFDLLVIPAGDTSTGITQTQGMNTERAFKFNAFLTGDHLILLATKVPHQVGSYAISLSRVPEPQSQPAQSSESGWIELSSSDSEEYYLNQQVRDLGGDRRGVWTETRHRAPKRILGSESMEDSTYYFWEVDCRSRLLGIRQLVHRFRDKVVKTYDYDPPKLAAPPPGSIGEVVISRACRQ